MVFTSISCKKDADESKTYTVTYNGRYEYATIKVFEYNKNGDPIANRGGSFKKGNTRTYTADKNATKVKLYLDLPFDIGWVKTVYTLSSSQTDIVIDDNTQLVFNEP